MKTIDEIFEPVLKQYDTIPNPFLVEAIEKVRTEIIAKFHFEMEEIKKEQQDFCDNDCSFNAS